MPDVTSNIADALEINLKNVYSCTMGGTVSMKNVRWIIDRFTFLDG